MNVLPKRPRSPRVAPAASGIVHFIQDITGPWTWENLVSWVKLVCVVLVVWWLGIQPFRIPSQSMYPTLNGDPRFFVGDRVFVNKWIFGPHIPFTNFRIFKGSEPRRWDVVVFRSVERDDPGKILIKRLVGLPGERIHIYDGKIYVNGVPQKLPDFMPKVYYLGDQPPLDEMIQRAVAAHPEDPQKAADEAEQNYRYCESMRARGLLKYGVLKDDQYAVVPPGHYLFLGDNSAHSQDGRYFGWVPQSHLLGRAFCVWWPFTHMKDLSGFTRTWSGLALLIGIPGLLIGYEVCRAYFYLPWRVRSHALKGQVARGERVIINRAAYGVRLSIPPVRLHAGRKPERGEAVAYTVASEKGGASTPELVFGRVAAVPGDQVSLDDGHITVNGHSTGQLASRAAESGNTQDVPKWLSRKGTTVPDDKYLVLAEDGSTVPDSRSLGWVPKEALVGSVASVYWPPHRMRSVRRQTSDRTSQ